MSRKDSKSHFSGILAPSNGTFAAIDRGRKSLYDSSMEFAIQDLPMDLPQPSPWAERVAYVRDSFGILVEAQKKHGGIVEARSAAKMAKISKSRLFQLLENQSIQRVTVRDARGEILIEGFSARSILDWAKTVKSGGRKFDDPLGKK